MHQVKETGQFYTANEKQIVQSISVDVLGSTALVGQDVYAKPSLCQNPHSATDDGPCRDCCPDTDITPGAHCIPTSEEAIVYIHDEELEHLIACHTIPKPPPPTIHSSPSQCRRMGCPRYY